MSQIIAPNMPLTGTQSVPGANREFAPELDLSHKNVLAPIYRYHRLNQVSGGTSVTLTSTGQTQSIFNIPGQSVYNLSKCFLEFDLYFPSIDATHPLVIWGDQVPIDQLVLSTNTGTQLALLQNLAPYTKVVRPAMTSYDEYIHNEPALGGGGATSALDKAQFKFTTNMFMQPGVLQSSVSAQPIAATEYNVQYIVDDIAGGASTAASANIFDTASGVDKAFQAPQRLVKSTAVAALGQITFHCKIPFTAFKGSILNLDKNLYFGQNLQLQINWSGLNKWGFSCVVGAADIAPTQLVPSAVAGVSTMQNLYLWTCVDTNLASKAMLMDEVNTSGISVLIPWTQCTSITGPSSASSFRYSTILTPGQGLVLKRVVTIPCNATDTLEMSSNCDNTPNATPANIKWSNVQTFLNASPLQDLPLVDQDNNVWAYMQPMLDGSAHGISNRQYRINAFWADNFSDSKKSKDWNDEDCKFSGLNLGMDAQVYDTQFQQTCTTSLKYYQYQTFLRKLFIRPNGISY